MIAELLQKYEAISGGTEFIEKKMKNVQNWRSSYETNKSVEKKLLAAIEKFEEQLNIERTGVKKTKKPRKTKLTFHEEEVPIDQQLEDQLARGEANLLRANQNVQLRRIHVNKQHTRENRMKEIESLVDSTEEGEIHNQDTFQKKFFPENLIKEYKNRASGRRVSAEKLNSLNPNQESVYAIAKLRAEEKINTPGLLVKHGTGSGKTISALLILLAFWDKRTPEGGLWTIILASSIQNQRRDNNIAKLAKHCIDYFPTFEALVDNKPQPIFSIEFYEQNKGNVVGVKNHEDFVVWLMLERFKKGLTETFVKNKNSAENEDVENQIDKYFNRRFTEKQLGLSYYGSLGYDLAMNTYKSDQIEFKSQATETQKVYSDLKNDFQKRFLPYINTFFETPEKRRDFFSQRYYRFKVTKKTGGEGKRAKFIGTFFGVDQEFKNIPFDNVRVIPQPDERKTRSKKNVVEEYEAMYPPFVDRDSDVFVNDFADHVIELGEALNNEKLILEKLTQENQNDHPDNPQKKREIQIALKESKTKVKEYQKKFNDYIIETYDLLSEYFLSLFVLGEPMQINEKGIKTNLLPVYRNVLQNVYNIKFDNGDYALLDVEFKLQNLEIQEEESDDIVDEAQELDDFRMDVDEAAQRDELRQDLNDIPYLKMNEYRKIQYCVFVFDEMQLLFDVPPAETAFRHKYRQLIHCMKYYRDPETTWLVGLTATPGSYSTDVSEIMSMITTVPDVVTRRLRENIKQDLETERTTFDKKSFTYIKPGVYTYQRKDYIYLADDNNGNVILRPKENPFSSNIDELVHDIEEKAKMLVSYVDFTGDYSIYPRKTFERICIPFGSEDSEREDESNEEYNDNGNDNDDDDNQYADLLVKYEVEKKILQRLIQFEHRIGTKDAQNVARNMFIQMNGFYDVAEFFDRHSNQLEYIPYDREGKLPDVNESMEFQKRIKVTKKEIYTTLARGGLYLNIPKNYNNASFGKQLRLQIKPFTFNSTSRNTKAENERTLIVSNKLKAVVHNLMNAIFDSEMNFKENPGKHYVYCSDVIGLNIIAYLLFTYSNKRLAPYGYEDSIHVEEEDNNNNNFGMSPNSNSSNTSNRSSPKSNISNRSSPNVKEKPETPKEVLFEPSNQRKYYFLYDSKKTQRKPVNTAYVPLSSANYLKAKQIASSKDKDGTINVNLRGEIIPIIFATGESFKGVDMAAISHIHVVDAFLDFQNFLQLVGRGPRIRSHALLPAAQRVVKIIMYQNDSNVVDQVSATYRNQSMSIDDFDLSSDYMLWNRSVDDYKYLWNRLNVAFAKVAIDRNVFHETFHQGLQDEMDNLLNIGCGDKIENAKNETKKKGPSGHDQTKSKKVDTLIKFINELNRSKHLTRVQKYFDFDRTLYKIKKVGRNYNVIVKIPNVMNITKAFKLPITFGYIDSTKNKTYPFDKQRKKDIKLWFEELDKLILLEKERNIAASDERYETYKKFKDSLAESYNNVKNLMTSELTPVSAVNRLRSSPVPHEQQSVVEFGSRKRSKRHWRRSKI